MGTNNKEKIKWASIVSLVSVLIVVGIAVALFTCCSDSDRFSEQELLMAAEWNSKLKSGYFIKTSGNGPFIAIRGLGNTQSSYSVKCSITENDSISGVIIFDGKSNRASLSVNSQLYEIRLSAENYTFRLLGGSYDCLFTFEE